MELIKVIKSTLHQSLSIYKMSFGDYRVVYSSKQGYQTKDFGTLIQAEHYANRRANIIK